LRSQLDSGYSHLKVKENAEVTKIDGLETETTVNNVSNMFEQTPLTSTGDKLGDRQEIGGTYDLINHKSHCGFGRLAQEILRTYPKNNKRKDAETSSA
jgi:hypothetical protein